MARNDKCPLYKLCKRGDECRGPGEYSFAAHIGKLVQTVSSKSGCMHGALTDEQIQTRLRENTHRAVQNVLEGIEKFKAAGLTAMEGIVTPANSGDFKPQTYTYTLR